MIGRVWHGWTTTAKADAYEAVLRREVLPGIAAMDVEGYRGSEVLRRTLDSGEVEVALGVPVLLEEVPDHLGSSDLHGHGPQEGDPFLLRRTARPRVSVVIGDDELPQHQAGLARRTAQRRPRQPWRRVQGRNRREGRCSRPGRGRGAGTQRASGPSAVTAASDGDPRRQEWADD